MFECKTYLEFTFFIWCIQTFKENITSLRIKLHCFVATIQHQQSDILSPGMPQPSMKPMLFLRTGYSLEETPWTSCTVLFHNWIWMDFVNRRKSQIITSYSHSTIFFFFIFSVSPLWFSKYEILGCKDHVESYAKKKKKKITYNLLYSPNKLRHLLRLQRTHLAPFVGIFFLTNVINIFDEL